MMRWWKAVSLLCLLALGTLLVGCPGMPGMPGAGGAGTEQKSPPGVLPPPGLESGGVRTLMGSTITAPENSYLLVRFTRVRGQAAGAAATWQSCRRVSVVENCLMIEGLNYDGRDDVAPKDANLLIPYTDLESFDWKYEARPAPPAAAPGKGQPKPSGRTR